MIIRSMEQKDAAHVLAMMQDFYNSSATLVKSPTEVLQQDIDHCLSDMPFIEGYVFEENQKLLGYAMVAKSYSTEYGGMCLWLEDLYMEPHARGKGIGPQFIQFLEENYKGKAVRLRLEVTQSNSAAIKIYEKIGFSLVNYVEMTKKL